MGNGYVFDKKKGAGGKLIQQWKDQVKQLGARVVGAGALFDSDDPRVHGRQMLALRQDSTRAGTDWSAASRAQRARLEEAWARVAVHQLGGRVRAGAWNDWGLRQTACWT